MSSWCSRGNTWSIRWSNESHENRPMTKIADAHRDAERRHQEPHRPPLDLAEHHHRGRSDQRGRARVARAASADTTAAPADASPARAASARSVRTAPSAPSTAAAMPTPTVTASEAGRDVVQPGREPVEVGVEVGHPARRPGSGATARAPRRSRRSARPARGSAGRSVRFVKPSALSTAICVRSRNTRRDTTTLTRNAATPRNIAGITSASVRSIVELAGQRVVRHLLRSRRPRAGRRTARARGRPPEHRRRATAPGSSRSDDVVERSLHADTRRRPLSRSIHSTTNRRVVGDHLAARQREHVLGRQRDRRRSRARAACR